MPVARHAWARYRKRKYERRIQGFLRDGSGRADRLPQGAVYEATMRCNLHCEFCYVLDFLNIEGEWREEMPIERLQQAFPDRAGFQVSLTGGEIFMRKDILSVLDLFREKGYACGYLTTNGTIISEERAEALADLAAAGFLKHISVSVDGPGDLHDRARGLKGTFARTDRRPEAPAGCGPAQACAAARQHQHHRGPREPRSARPDGGRRRRARRRRNRPEPPDVQHARGSGGDGPACIGAADPSVIATFVTRESGARRRARARKGRRARREVPAAQHPVRLSPEGPFAADRELLHARREAGRPLPLPVPPRARGFLRQGVLLPVHPGRGRRSRRPRRSRRSGTGRPTSRCGGGCSNTASSRSAAAAARSSSRPSRWRSRFPRASRRGAPSR